jgi:hypothetical protein
MPLAVLGAVLGIAPLSLRRWRVDPELPVLLVAGPVLFWISESTGSRWVVGLPGVLILILLLRLARSRFGTERPSRSL